MKGAFAIIRSLLSVISTLLIGSMVCSVTCSAWPNNWPSAGPIEEPKKIPTQNIRSFRLDGKSIPMGGQCEAILTEAQIRLSRELTPDELRTLLPKILSATNEELVEISPLPKRDDSPMCFTGRMRILTPKGEVQISTLKEGDEVISVDLITGKPVVNKIFRITKARRPYSVLRDLGRPIEVTGRHQFYSSQSFDRGEMPGLHPIEEVPESGFLFGADLKRDSGQILMPTRRGRFLPEGLDDVVDLTMIGEPRNFIVEGILVHNIMVKI